MCRILKDYRLAKIRVLEQKLLEAEEQISRFERFKACYKENLDFLRDENQRLRQKIEELNKNKNV